MENNTEILRYRKQMPKTSLYGQCKAKPARNFVFKTQARSLSSFLSCNSSGVLFPYFSETLEEPFKELQLVQSLHRLLQDDNTSPEVKYNSMGLLCSLLNSGNSILSCLWRKEGYLWRKHQYVLLLKCAKVQSVSCKECFKSSFFIDHQKCQSRSFFLYKNLIKPSVELKKNHRTVPVSQWHNQALK